MEQSGCTVQQCVSDEPGSSFNYRGWELVLLVVGAVLAGVGISAILGGIVFVAKQKSLKLYTQV